MGDWSDDEDTKPKKAPASSSKDNDDFWGDTEPKKSLGDRSSTFAGPRVGRGGYSGGGGDRPPRRERSEGGEEVKENIKVDGSKTGRIVGSGGSTIKELQSEHYVKINIAKEDDEDGQRNVEVVGQEADVKNAIKAIRDKTGDRPRRDQFEDDSDAYRETIKVEGRKTGRIVGSGGSTIKELQSDHSVKINISKEDDEDGNRDVEVVGLEADVQNAIKAIRDKTDGDRPPRNDAFGGFGDEDKFKECFLVETGKIGKLVGKQGAQINEFQSTFSVKINISKEDDSEGKRDVEVLGDETDVKKAVKAIKEKLSSNIGADGAEKPREMYVPPDPTSNEDEMFSSGISAGINFDKFDKIDVSLSGDGAEAFKKVASFEAIGLRDLIMQNVKRSGYTKPTPIQKLAIPVIMAGRDLMGCAQTGSGKTAAFMLPILHRIMADGDSCETGKPQCLIVAPTRELAIQIYEEARKFANQTCVKICIVYGGTATRHQSDLITRGGVHIIVATPGRLMDFVGKGLISFEDLKFLVLDEADKMLEMGFIEKITEITAHPTYKKEEVQTLMFSATFPEEIQRYAGQFLQKYIFLTIGIIGGASTDVEQEIVEVERLKKRKKLTDILDMYCNSSDEDRILVFVETKKNADFLASILSETKISSTSIHGDRLQSERETALREFRAGKRKVLIATSVAARGLDIKGVTHVINYDLPKDVQDYVHRIGRTGRVGNKGKATSFYDPDQDSAIAESLARIMKDAGQQVPEFLGCSGESYDQGDNFGGTDIRKGISTAKKQEAEDEW